MEKVIYEDLGLVDYKNTWDYQFALSKELIERKKNSGKATKTTTKNQRRHYLLFCEHPPVYTLGKSGSIDNLLLSQSELIEKNIGFHKINRGGDITFHGPGQLVVYPIFDLDGFSRDIYKYVRTLEEVVIKTLAEYNIEGKRIEKYTGVWLDATQEKPNRKICAIGVHNSRWVTMHGFAFNINTDLDYFNNIIPCGINESDKSITSLEKELGKKINIQEIKEKVKNYFAELFGLIFV